MSKGVERMLKALHEGLVLQRSYRSGSEFRFDVHAWSWTLEEWGDGGAGQTAVLVEEMSREHRRGYSDHQYEGLWVDDLVATVPHGSSASIHVLSPAGLAHVQQKFGPIQVPVLVTHDDGTTERVSPVEGALAVPTGEDIVVRGDNVPEVRQSDSEPDFSGAPAI